MRERVKFIATIMCHLNMKIQDPPRELTKNLRWCMEENPELKYDFTGGAS